VFFIVTACRDCAKFLPECVGSVLKQRRIDWRMCIAVDDVGSDVGAATLRVARKLAEQSPRILVISNQDRLHALRTRVDAIDRFCPHDAIVVKLDGDDYLYDSEVLSVLAKEYTDPEMDAVWTQFVTVAGKKGFCGPLPENANPASHKWVSSHLQTFRKRALWGVRRECFVDNAGKWWSHATDQALYLPILAVARKRRFVDKVCYVYRVRGTDNTRAAQNKTAAEIRSKIKTSLVFARKNVLFMISGPGRARDARLYYNEKRPFLGVLNMSSHLRARGHRVRLVDRHLKPAWFPSDEILLDWADIVGIYISTPAKNDGCALIKDVRDKGFGGPVYTGGPHSVLHPEAVRSAGADFVSTFEADYAISRLVETGSAAPSGKRVLDLDSLPFPDYALVKEQGLSYTAKWPYDGTAPVMSLNSSRSCPYSCAFCETRRIWGREWYAQSPQRMLLDADYMYRKYRPKGIYYRESNFGCNRTRVTMFCDLLKKHGPDVRWACEIRADRVCDESLVSKMSEAGCRGFYIGAEAATDRLLKQMNKGITVAQIRKACKNASKYGVKVALSFVTDFPGETQEDIKARAVLIKGVQKAVHWCNKYRATSDF